MHATMVIRGKGRKLVHDYRQPVLLPGPLLSSTVRDFLSDLLYLGLMSDFGQGVKSLKGQVVVGHLAAFIGLDIDELEHQNLIVVRLPVFLEL